MKKTLALTAVVAIVAVMFVSLPLISFAAGTTITVSTNKSSYPVATGTPIIVSGSISPAPGVSNTYATVQIKNPNGTLMVIDSTPVDATTGAFSDTLASGAGWPNGVYTVDVSWAASAGGTVDSGSTTFVYGTVVTTSSTSTSTSTTQVSTVTSTVTTTLPGTTVTSLSTITVPTTLTSTTTTTVTSGTWETIGIAGIVLAVVFAGLAGFMMMRRH